MLRIVVAGTFFVYVRTCVDSCCSNEGAAWEPNDVYEMRSPELPCSLLLESGLPATLRALRVRTSYGAYSSMPSNDEGGRRKGDGAREGKPE